MAGLSIFLFSAHMTTSVLVYLQIFNVGIPIPPSCNSVSFSFNVVTTHNLTWCHLNLELIHHPYPHLSNSISNLIGFLRLILEDTMTQCWCSNHKDRGGHAVSSPVQWWMGSVWNTVQTGFTINIVISNARYSTICLYLIKAWTFIRHKGDHFTPCDGHKAKSSQQADLFRKLWFK